MGASETWGKKGHQSTCQGQLGEGIVFFSGDPRLTTEPRREARGQASCFETHGFLGAEVIMWRESYLGETASSAGGSLFPSLLSRRMMEEGSLELGGTEAPGQLQAGSGRAHHQAIAY